MIINKSVKELFDDIFSLYGCQQEVTKEDIENLEKLYLLSLKKQDILKIARIWAMPNKWTFKIKPIKEIVDRYVGDGKGWIDPFAGMNSPAEFTNDLNLKANAKYHLKAIDFINLMNGQTFKGVLFDPPYSGRQVKECYNDLDIEIQRDDTNLFFYYVHIA